MDDLISRQAAIDIVDRIAEGKITLNDARDLIRMLEPTQPNLQPTCNQLATDCISRQAAIEAVGYYSLHSGDKLLFADKPLKSLPSAQPDIARDIATILENEQDMRVIAQNAQPDTTLLAQKIWTKVCLITDPEDANLQHEVIHYGDLKQVFLEVLGWTI